MKTRKAHEHEEMIPRMFRAVSDSRHVSFRRQPVMGKVFRHFTVAQTISGAQEAVDRNDPFVQNEFETLSYLKGGTSTPLIHQTVGDMFDTTCHTYPDNTALIVPFQNIRWSYKELQYQTNRLASHLVSLGLRSGDRIGIWSPNSAEWIVTQMATAKVGLILVNINPAYRLHELKYALNKVQCKALITAHEFKTSNHLQMLMNLLSDDTNTSEAFQSYTLPYLKYIISLGEETQQISSKVIPYSHFMAADPTSSEQDATEKTAASIQPTDPINLQFTSGMTGRPKAATLTSLGLVNNGRIVGEYMKLTDKDVLCLPVPLYHCFGMVLGNLACFSHGATVVLPNPDFCPKQTLRVVH